MSDAKPESLNVALDALLEHHTPGQIVHALRKACAGRFNEDEFDEDGDLEQPCLDWISVGLTLDAALRDINRYASRLGLRGW